MDILKIKKYPDKVLRAKCRSLKDVAEDEVKLFEDMLFTMHYFEGIGLAAPQIGISKNLIVIDIGEGPIKLANPEIIKSKGSDKMVEGCLSVPGTSVEVVRPSEIIITGLDEKGHIVEFKAKGLLARVFQHEIDHLKGKLIVDYMGLIDKIKLKMNSRKKYERM